MIAELSAPGNNAFRVKSALYFIAGQFLTNRTFHQRECRKRREVMETVIVWLPQHFREPISLKDLAAYTGYHYNYLSAWLHKQMNRNFSELVNEYRIDLASDVLTPTDQSIIKIAGQCGSETVRTFNCDFLRLRGMTPNQFRNSRR